MEQYLLITSPSEPNIGVLKIKENDKIVENPDFQKRLIAQLEEYYGLPIYINKMEQVDFNFIEIKVQVTINAGEQNSFSETISLDETRIY
jgi:anaerobic ribonucleoside-triphosphate reductase